MYNFFRSQNTYGAQTKTLEHSLQANMIIMIRALRRAVTTGKGEGTSSDSKIHQYCYGCF